MSRISRAGSGHCATSLSASFLCLWLAVPCAISAKDGGTVSQWLSSHIFEGNGATLILCRDGFFGLRLAAEKKKYRYLTGRWRVSADGVELTLYNNQDAAIRLTVGQSGIHAILPKVGDVTLTPTQMEYSAFQIVGPLGERDKKTIITDANSGRAFTVNAQNAPIGKFATAEVEIGTSGAKPGKILAHSGSTPRFFQMPQEQTGIDTFLARVVNRYWLLPPMKDFGQVALRLAPPDGQAKNLQHKTSKTHIKQTNKSADRYNENILEGTFEITGQGLRLDGTYQLSGSKLTLRASRGNIQNLFFIGAGDLAKTFLGELSWQLSPGGLELEGKQRILLLPQDAQISHDDRY